MRAGRRSTTGAEATSTQSRAEDFVAHRENVRHVHVREVVLSGDTLGAELAVTRPAMLIRKHLVSFGAFREFDLGFAFVRTVIAVGVILHGQPAVGALDLFAVRFARDAEDFVIISFDRGHKGFGIARYLL